MLTRGTVIYIVQRVILIAFTVLVVSFGVFYAVHSLPGNAFISEKLHGESLQAVLHSYGLDRPIPVQYWDFLRNALHGDFGQSFVIQGQPITPLLVRELSVSMMLGGAALLITIGMGIPFGVVAAMRQNTAWDYSLTTFAVIGYSVPSFVIENLFGIPGLGKEFVRSITAHDYNITVAVFSVYAALIGVANLAVDLVYTVIDPRIRY